MVIKDSKTNWEQGEVRGFFKQMQSRVTCAIGWTWQPLMHHWDMHIIEQECGVEN